MKRPPIRSLLADPYALIFRGGAMDGKRPFTRIAMLTARKPDGNYLGLLGSGWRWTKPRPIQAADIVARWPGMPSPAALRQARETVPARTTGDMGSAEEGTPNPLPASAS